MRSLSSIMLSPGLVPPPSWHSVMFSNVRSSGAEPRCQFTSVPGLPSQGSCRALLCALQAVPGLQELHQPSIRVQASSPRLG